MRSVFHLINSPASGPTFIKVENIWYRDHTGLLAAEAGVMILFLFLKTL